MSVAQPLPDRLNRLMTLLKISQLISSRQNIDDILRMTVEAINKHLAYEDVALLLIHPDLPDHLVLRARSGIYVQGRSQDQLIPVAEGVIGEAFRSREPLLIEEVQGYPGYIPIPGAETMQSELAMPILFEDRLLGLLNIESEHLITPEDAADIGVVVQQLAIAIANAEQHAEEKRRSERLELIARVGQRIASRLDQQELFGMTLEDLHNQLGYDHVALFLTDPADATYLVQKARVSRWPRGESEGYRQSIQEGIIGLCARQRSPVLVGDVRSHPAYLAVPNADELRSELSVPLLLGDQLLGVLDLASSKSFTQADGKAMQIIADQLAVALSHASLFAEMEQKLKETELLYRTSRQISLAMSLKEIARAYLELVAVQGLYYCTIVIYDFDEQGQRVGIEVLGRWLLDKGLVQEREYVPYFKDDFDPILDKGQPVYMANAPTDPRASKTLRKAQRTRPALALIPLMVGDFRVGLVTLSHPKPLDWSKADLRAYLVTAAHLATAIYSRQQQEKVSQQAQELAAFSERQRLARDLHDSVNQLIFSMTLLAQSVAPAMKRSAPEGEERVARLLELAQRTRAEMRALLSELRPASNTPAMSDRYSLQREGLVQTLNQHFARLPGSLSLKLEAQDYQPQAEPIEEALLRIAQEAVGNVIKHARANEVRLRLSADKKACYLSVKDDGIGFDTKAVGVAGNLGLKTMQERALALGGVVKLVSSQGKGTELNVRIPLRGKMRKEA